MTPSPSSTDLSISLKPSSFKKVTFAIANSALASSVRSRTSLSPKRRDRRDPFSEKKLSPVKKASS